ncbi:hypothetical protein CLV51_1011063 [Chitinophaga niastensis]|uniref:Uncharacterized protein n=1 Tax=Chitinophaga niastensis TaxID=536980 RepID=A0A2P8HU39_CHINA|nr:hypothetical protein [Chitinophaga niastensis]PSL49728.1 hypothetical protein CLV51_1011063 [Chitinophaga niastensis]
MNVSMLRLSVFVVLLITVISCRKGELPAEQYFGKVEYACTNFSNTPKITVFFNGQRLDTLYPEHPSSAIQVAGTTGKLSFYIAGTDSLIADTTITIIKNVTQKYKVVYSKELNLKGFVGTPPAIAQDTAAYQLYLTLGSYYAQYKKVDVAWLYVDENGEIKEGEIIKGVESGKLQTTVHYLRALHANGDFVTYALQLKDPATGEVIPQANGESFFGSGQFSNKSFNIIHIFDDAGTPGGSIIEI